MTRRPLAILFDLDGTLLDSIELILNSARYAFENHPGYVPSDAEWLTGVGIPLPTMFRRYVASDVEVDALITRYREYQMEHHDRLVRCYDRVVETVEMLHEKGHPSAIVTSKAQWLARRGLEHVGLGSHFDVIVGCDSCERHKPDPQPVLVALDQLGYAPEDAAFVGDSVHDMEAGRAAAVTTIAATWGAFSREALESSNPDHYLSRMADLPALVARLQRTGNKGAA